jgi:hypothetical protein
MSIQTLLLSVLVTFVTVGVSFFYFKNRMARTEQKVDLMFQLIQEHEKSSQIRQQFIPAQHMGGQLETVQRMEVEKELIQISEDDDSDYDSDDSAEVSDSEDKLCISDPENDSLADTVKTISLSLEGAEISSNINIGDVDELEEHEILDEVENLIVNKLDSVEFEEVVEDELDDVVLSDEESISEDYSKMTKDQLKTIAEAKGLTHYKQLKKGALIDLINNAQ